MTDRVSVPYACVECQRSFKRLRAEDILPDRLTCPNCGAKSYRMSSDFKAPSKQNDKQWRKVAALIDAGFRFYKVGEPYPSTLSEVPDFVARHSPHNSN